MSNVMLIEDDFYFADDLKFFVEEAGHTCELFITADEVMKKIDDLGRFNVIILDIMLMKGELLKIEKASYETGELLFELIKSKYPKMFFIIVTAKDFDAMQVKFSQASNILLTIRKPLTESMIEKIVQTIPGPTKRQ